MIYCAEQFENDGSPVSTIVKGVKRAMAGEYSRELSTKVFKGQCRLIELGYRQGGTAGYGLRRMLIDAAGESKEQLSLGEQKSIHTDRVILVPGPPEEQDVVREIYRAFIDDRRNGARSPTTSIAAVCAPSAGASGPARWWSVVKQGRSRGRAHGVEDRRRSA